MELVWSWEEVNWVVEIKVGGRIQEEVPIQRLGSLRALVTYLQELLFNQ